MIIALDIGTTNVKAVAFEDGGRALAQTERRNQLLDTPAGHVEQSPELVFQNVTAALVELLLFCRQNFPEQKPRCVVLSSAMHGLVAVDTSGRACTSLMLWSDLRALKETRELRLEGGGAADLYERTGVPIHPMSPLLKIIWLQQNRPDIFQNTYKFLDIKAYIWFRLSGSLACDISCASATGLMNLRQMVWEERALSAAGITADQLPQLVSPTHTAWLKDEIWPDKTLLMIGASDGALANLGSGAIGAGRLAVTIGTSAAIRMLSETPVLDAQMRTFCYRLDENRFIVGGASNNGANTMEWLRTQVFRSPLDADNFANQAAQAPAGAGGLRFLPYLFGERAPLWDPEAQASFTGIRPEHTQAHFVRAVMEGVLHNLKTIADVLETHAPVQVLHASGGFTHNALWLSMLEDVFQRPVWVDNSSGIDASVRGAYLLARETLG